MLKLWCPTDSDGNGMIVVVTERAMQSAQWQVMRQQGNLTWYISMVRMKEGLSYLGYAVP